MNPEKLYRDHAAEVLGWVIRLGGAAMDPEDVAHEVFEIAIRKFATLETATCSPTTWLYGITRRVLANRRRAAWWRRVLSMRPADAAGEGDESAEWASDAEPPDEALEHERRRRAVQRALQRVSELDREVLVLAGMEERSAPETAEMLGIPVGTVHSRLHNARRRFASALAAEGIRSIESDAGRGEEGGGVVSNVIALRPRGGRP